MRVNVHGGERTESERRGDHMSADPGSRTVSVQSCQIRLRHLTDVIPEVLNILNNLAHDRVFSTPRNQKHAM